MNRLAVLIPVYNDPRGLAACLAPLAAAGGGFDVLVVDDGSEPPLDEAGAGLPFAVRCHRLPANRGIAAALNAGLALIRGRDYAYVARLDAWDICAPERFGLQMAFLDRHERHVVVASDVEFIDRAGAPLYRYAPQCEDAAIRREMRYRPSFIHPASMLRLAALERTGGYSEAYPGAEDYELFWRLLDIGLGANLPDVLLKVYLNPLGISQTRRRQLIRSRLRLQLDRFGFADPHSYFGILRTLALAGMPYSLAYALKRLARPPAQEEAGR